MPLLAVANRRRRRRNLGFGLLRSVLASEESTFHPSVPHPSVFSPRPSALSVSLTPRRDEAACYPGDESPLLLRGNEMDDDRERIAPFFAAASKTVLLFAAAAVAH